MGKNPEREIIQMIPAEPGWFATFTNQQGEEYQLYVVCWALVKLTYDDGGRPFNIIEGVFFAEGSSWLVTVSDLREDELRCGTYIAP